MTFLNVFILFANKLRSNGCEHLTFIWERREFESAALNNRSIEYFDKRDTDVSRGGTSVLRLSRSRTQDGRQPYADEMLDETLDGR